MSEMNYVSYTKQQLARSKVSDGKSVKVSVPTGSGAITAGNFYYFDGFLGVAMRSLENDAANVQELILQIEAAEYETDQINDAQDFNKGTRIFWDNDNKRFTETATTIYAGAVTSAKDDNNVIWFVLTPGVTGDEAMTAIGDLSTLETTEKTELVGALNEIKNGVDAVSGQTQGTPGFTVSDDETADVRIVTVQVKDVAGTAVKKIVAIRAWLSDTAGAGETNAAPQVSAAPDTTKGSSLEEVTANKHYIALTDANGQLTFKLDNTGGSNATWYLNVEQQGCVYSEAIELSGTGE